MTPSWREHRHGSHGSGRRLLRADISTTDAKYREQTGNGQILRSTSRDTLPLTRPYPLNLHKQCPLRTEFSSTGAYGEVFPVIHRTGRVGGRCVIPRALPASLSLLPGQPLTSLSCPSYSCVCDCRDACMCQSGRTTLGLAFALSFLLEVVWNRLRSSDLGCQQFTYCVILLSQDYILGLNHSCLQQGNVNTLAGANV